MTFHTDDKVSDLGHTGLLSLHFIQRRSLSQSDVLWADSSFKQAILAAEVQLAAPAPNPQDSVQ